MTESVSGNHGSENPKQTWRSTWTNSGQKKQISMAAKPNKSPIRKQNKKNNRYRKPKKIDPKNIEEFNTLKSDNGWKPRSLYHDNNRDDFNAKIKVAQGYLNKMTYSTFDKLSDKFIDIANQHTEYENLLGKLIDKIFEQALIQKDFCELYANLCYKIYENIKVFRKHLLIKCQREFEKDHTSFDATTPEYYKAKKRMLGNIKFIGELFKTNILVTPVMYLCFDKLLIDATDVENIEALCKLLLNIGEILDKDNKLDKYFSQLYDIKEGDIPKRVKFLIQDVIDVRKNGWKPLK